MSDILWFKIIQSGIRGKQLDRIQSMYSNIKSRVKYETNLSDEFSLYWR